MTPVLRTCPVCAKNYVALEERLRWGRQTTCGRACSYRLRTAKSVQPRQQFTCPVCQSVFALRPHAALKARKGPAYCSRHCARQGIATGITPKGSRKPPTYSPEAKAAMIRAAKKPKGKRVFHPLVCAYCNKDFEDKNWGRPRKSGNAFCSLACCNAFRVGASNPAWRGGHPEYYGQRWKPLRRTARQRDNHSCKRCGKTKEQIGQEPDVHHIRPVVTFRNPDDSNELENVICLCHPCHEYVEWHGMDFQK